jgi:hypothetical protein
VISSGSRLEKGLARHGARALFLAAGLAGLASCDYWIGDAAATMPDEAAWQVLPMRAFLSHPNVDVGGMQLCTVARCGYDAAIERFTATGDQASALERSLGEPRQLAASIDRPEPGSKMPPPKVTVEDFGNGGWSGLHVSMIGGKKSHRIDGYVVSRRNPAGTTFIVVIAGDGDVAKRLVTIATR